MAKHALPVTPKFATGVDGLDQILRGGLPAARTTLIIGGPGTGKSLLGLEFLYRSALAGQAGVFISFEEGARALRSNAATLGWDLAPLEHSGKLFLLEARLDPRAVVTGSFGIQPFLLILEAKLKAMGARRVVIDALDVLLRLIDNECQQQDELLALHRWLEEREITALLTVKAPREGQAGGQFDFLDYLADCVIHLDNRLLGQLSTRRLRVAKYRGSGFGSNEYPFVIDPPGIKLLPISDVDLSHCALGARFSIGLPALDGLLGGGLRRASSVLVSGSTGTGKTTLCSAFGHAASARGEKVLYISFEESEAALVSAMRSPGIDLAPAIASGAIGLLTAMPEAMGAEQHLLRALAAIQRLQPDCVVLESASACKRMGTEQAAFEYLMRLINSCKEMGVCIVVSNQTNGLSQDDDLSGIGISSLIDVVIQLRLVEDQGGLARKLLVMKARGSCHSHHYHDFVITDHGIDLQCEVGR
jgi:circadian clock protein KaiC